MKKNRENNCSSIKATELVKSCSGRWFEFSENDISIFVADTVKVLKKYILPGETIGLFLDLDNAQFTSLILYHACILCDAGVIRCGISDLERQLPIDNDICLDWVICTNWTSKYILSRINYKRKIIVNRASVLPKDVMYFGEPSIYDLYDVPGFIMCLDKNIICPGYEIVQNEETLLLKKKVNIENIKISEVCVEGVNLITELKPRENDIIKEFVKLFVSKIITEDLNGAIYDETSIVLNSIGLVELLVKIEDEYGISFTIENIEVKNFEQIDRLAKLILTALMEKINE